MDFLEQAKSAFKNAYLSGIKKKLIMLGIGIVAFIILITILVGVILPNDEENIFTDESQTTIGKDYVVNTAISEKEIIITDSMTLKNAVNSLSCNEQAKSNINNNMNTFLNIQSQYNVNAVFAISAMLVESGGGTAWDLIDSSTNNCFSIKAGSSWTGAVYIDEQGTSWRVYNSIEDAIYDFAELISESSYYFGGENYTVSSIAPSYCNEEWGKRVIEVMTNIFEACGIDTSGYIDVSGSQILRVSSQLFNQVYLQNYSYGSTSIPPYNGIIDCSSFVDWVMYELGYTDFGGVQRNTEWWYALNSAAYGWTEFYIGNNDISVLQPGDIIVLNGTSYNKVTGKTEYRHHMQIFVSAKDSTHAYVYDCGGTSNWSVNSPTKGDSTFWGYVDAKVIRITTPTDDTDIPSDNSSSDIIIKVED